VKYLLRKCEGEFHFTSTEGRYFTIHEVNYFTFGNAEYFTKKCRTKLRMIAYPHGFALLRLPSVTAFQTCFARQIPRRRIFDIYY